jgi:hypothetical protein
MVMSDVSQIIRTIRGFMLLLGGIFIGIGLEQVFMGCK